MSAIVNFFQDNAMFYKDITQWLRNRTFGSLFFGLLLAAEALSLFVIAGSDGISNPGVSMFYALYLVLIVYAILIAYLGNGLTAREFMNRTFELFELSGMSLERMIGGKLLSMLYQFFFGFFCLVPFMFFAYFLGGLDFFEMLVGIVIACLLALPLYLLSLAGALTGRLKQISLLIKLASLFFITMFTIYSFFSLFSSQPIMQGLVREITEQLKKMINGEFEIAGWIAMFLFIYAQVCLLLFYYCCDSISRETDSREIPLKVLTLTLVVSWIASYGILFAVHGYTAGAAYQMVVPIFIALLALGVSSFYSSAAVPPIVARRYADAKGLRRVFFTMFKPGIVGGVRTILLLIAVAVISATLFSTGISGGSEWRSALSLLVQVPWFLAIPHIFYARSREIRYNYTTQRTLAVTAWVIMGALVLIYLAWTRSGIYGNSYNTDDSSTVLDILLVTLLSPLSSLSAVGSRDETVRELGAVIHVFSGLVGVVLVWRHMVAVVQDEGRLKLEAAGTGNSLADDGNGNTLLQEPPLPPDNADETA